MTPSTSPSATLAGCHVATVRRAIAAGQLTRYTSGPDRKGYRLRRTDVERWITPTVVTDPRIGGKLPRDVSGEDRIRALERVGYVRVTGRHGSSHVRLTSATRKPLTVPLYAEIGPRLLRRIIREAGMTVPEFLGLLGRA